MAVPLVDLSPSNRVLRDFGTTVLGRMLDDGDFINGDAVGKFERAWAKYVGARYCVGVSSGLDALRLALLACGVGPGSFVAVPAFTFQATWEAVTQTGAEIVAVDVDGDGLMKFPRDPVDASVPVHLYGRRAIAMRVGVMVEDCAQAHGLQRLGPDAAARAWSFYPTKPLGAIGDAGAVTTNNADVAAAVIELREHGQSGKYAHRRVGYTARLDTIQAEALLWKLPELDERNEQRREAARRYDNMLSTTQVIRPRWSDDHVWHLYTIRTDDPIGLAEFLTERGIETGRHYPVPPHLSLAYAHLGFVEGDFPTAEMLAWETLSLPLFAGITEAQQVEVVEGVNAWLASR